MLYAYGVHIIYLGNEGGDVMGQCVKGICAVSVIYGLLGLIIKSRGVKRAADMACAAALVLCVICSFKTLDLSEYAKQLTRYRDYEYQLTEDTQNITDRLNRLVIEEELRAYITDEADKRGAEIYSVSFTMEWDDCWYPSGCEINASAESEQIMTGFIETQLGIGREEQTWIR